ncbi:MAG: hypothetical protein K2O14_07685, partial [Oscillospiraceae bacterium]|nr:hypothetical protein [Oscillospiraceae bacterium]
MIILPQPVNEAIERLENAGFDAYIVGACVRELILGNSPQDFDIVTNAEINDILFAFRDYRISDEGMQRGEILVTVVGMIIQVSPYRREVVGNRVMYAQDLETDLFRRGFTMNAMAYSPRSGLIDPYGGKSCLTGEIKRVVAIGENVTINNKKDERRDRKNRGEESDAETYYDMSRSFTIAPWRLLQAIRYCAEDEYEIDEATQAAMQQNVSCFEYAESGRIFEELSRIVMGRVAARVVEKCGDIL